MPFTKAAATAGLLDSIEFEGHETATGVRISGEGKIPFMPPPPPPPSLPSSSSQDAVVKI